MDFRFLCGSSLPPVNDTGQIDPDFISLGGSSFPRVWKNTILVNPENQEIRIWPKNCKNCNKKFKLQQDWVNYVVNPDASIFFYLTGTTWYYHAIYIIVTKFASF